MERLVIIDHADHTLFIEDVADEALEQYGGSEEAYIKDNYTFEGDFSWDFITDAEYFPEGESTPVEVEFRDLV